jgi:aminoglycoside phosphotransferase (APT) family kinase protein
MTDFIHNLPDGLLPWLETLGPGKITRLERHVARREAWVVDVQRQDGTLLEGFLRIDRNPREGSNVSLRREARICESLMHQDIPVPALLAWNEVHHAALFSRDQGRADIHNLTNTEQQRAVMEDFMDVVARLHQLDPKELELEDILGPLPTSAADCALGDLNLQLQQFQGFLDHYSDPLMTYGVSWLRRFVPETVDRVSLVQGDTGPVNFMFQSNKVSAVVDWEWGHWGDPMEDLGNICVREFWNPSGGLSELFRRYEKQSGITYTRFAAQYYRIQQNVRGMIPLHAATQQSSLDESLAWYLCYRYVGDRATCEALADAMNVEIIRPELPKELRSSVMAKAAVSSLEKDVVPRLEDDFAKSRSRDVAILIQCLDRQQQYAGTLEAIETEEMNALLGASFKDYEAALQSLDEAIKADQLEDTPLIQYLCRRAYRNEWLFSPAVQLYPNRQWSPLD